LRFYVSRVLHAPHPMRFTALCLAIGLLPFAASRHSVATQLQAALDLSTENSLTTENHRGIRKEDHNGHMLTPEIVQLQPAKKFVGDDCDSCKGFINYPVMLQSISHPLFFFPFVILWAAALIWLLNTTAQEYFVPPLEYWARRLNLSPEVAGATLVALGNGAPDLFTVATAAQTEDIALGLTELLGGIMPVLCVTGGVVCLLADGRKDAPDKSASARQVEEGRPTECAAQALNDNPQASEIALADNLSDGNKCLAESTTDSASLTDNVGNAWFCITLVYLSILIWVGRVPMRAVIPVPAMYVLYFMSLLVASRWRPRPAQSEQAPEESDGSLTGMAMPAESSPLEFAGWMLAWPTYAVRWILIPSADCKWDALRRTLTSLSPTGLALLWILCRPDDFQSGTKAPQLCFLGSALVLSLCIFFGSDNGPKLPSFYPAITLLSKISSIFVLSIIAGELTSLVESVGVVKGISRLWLGTTVISWGNSLGDLVTAIALVRHGHALTAITAVFAGPLFNLLVGGGLALVIVCAREGGEATLVGAHSKPVLLANFAFLMVSSVLVTIALRSVRQQGSYSRLWPWLLFGLYGCFLVVVLALEGAM